MKSTLSCSLSVLTSIRLLFLCVLDTVGVAGIVSGSSFTGCPAFAVNVICNTLQANVTSLPVYLLGCSMIT